MVFRMFSYHEVVLYLGHSYTSGTHLRRLEYAPPVEIITQYQHIEDTTCYVLVGLSDY
jgi:hypothetical protein